MPKTYCPDITIEGDGAVATAGAGQFPWTKTTVQTGGTPTVNYLNEVVNIHGGVELALDATSEAQSAALTWGDALSIDLDHLYYYEFMARMTVLATGNVSVVMGLASEYNADPDSVAESIWFRMDANGAVTIEFDDATNTSDDVATGLTNVANEWRRYGIAFKETVSGLADIYMFMSRTGSSGDVEPQRFMRVAATTTIRLDSYATTARGLQPYFQVRKASGTGVGTLQIASPIRRRVSSWV